MNEVVIISDGDASGIQRLLDMYNDHLTTKPKVTVFSYTREFDNVKNALIYAYKSNAYVYYAVVNVKFSDVIKKFCTKYSLQCTNFYNDYADNLDLNLNFTEYKKSLDEDYFNRIECIEFAIENDDGKSYRKIKEADLIILGVSRTGKTPLSMYLALEGYKVINIPLFDNMQIPEEIFSIDNKKIFGLINSVNNISSIRNNRVNIALSNYASKEQIIKELDFAYNLYKKIGCDIINTESLAVEEIAHYIEKKLRRK